LLGQLARRPSRVRFDLLNQINRAADLLREVCLGQIERLASPPQPIAKRVRAIHPILRPWQPLSAPAEALLSHGLCALAVRVFVRLIVLQIQTS